MKAKKFFKKILIMSLLIYVAYVFIGQQKTLNSYRKSQAYYKKQIDEQLSYQENLKEKKENVNSEEYIEKIAREKLDMYLPNERVYIDSSN